MDKYQNWLNLGLKRLDEDFSNQVFIPQNESDIKCHMYHTLLQTKPQVKGLTSRHIVLSEFEGLNLQERFDLAIGSWKKKDKILEPRLLIEIKETSQAHLTTENVNERIKDDVDKLRRYRKALEEKKMMTVLKRFRLPVIIFFFRGAGIHGIGTKTDHYLKELQNSYDDIALLWGPTE
jgi:hypothetical protein